MRVGIFETSAKPLEGRPCFMRRRVEEFIPEAMG